MELKYLNNRRPVLTAMVQASTPEEAICIIENSLYDGAEAFAIQLENLKREYRTEETLRSIFSYCEGRPIYITSYRNSESTGMTDEECMEYLLLGLKAGATLCDVMGDCFDPQPHELSFDETAIQKQKAVIDKIHEMGGEVIMSSHLHAFFEEEEILRYAKAQEERGADIVKIVSFAQTRAQMMADLQIIDRLKQELDKPFLFLANGPHSKLIRQMGPALGVCMYLCVQHYAPINSKEQPQLRAAKAIRDAMCL